MTEEQKGLITFFLFTKTTEQFNKAIDEEEKLRLKKRINSYLALESTKNYLFKYFDIPSKYFSDSITLHRIGTTSYIFLIQTKASPNSQIEKYALKLLKFRYHDFSTIRFATSTYKNVYNNHSKHAPYIYESNDLFIIMDFIDGETLGEYTKRNLKDLPDNSDELDNLLDKVTTIVGGICNALQYYKANDVVHGDLSPENIIIVETSENTGIKLIDFGINYLLTERIGSLGSFSKAQRYLAPEVKGDDFAPHAAESDYYSLGIILLEMITHQNQELTTVEGQLAWTWERYPHLAKAIEELLENNHEDRNNNFPGGYSEIHRKILVQLTMHKEIYLNHIDSFIELIHKVGINPLAGLLKLVYRQIYVLAKRVRSLKRQNQERRDEKILLVWMTVTECIHLFALFLFVYLLGEDVYSALNVDEPSLILSNLNRSIFKNDELLSNFYGRMVAVSTSFLARKYYLNIYGTIRSAGSKSAEAVMRMSAVAFIIPVYGTLFAPSYWAYFAGVAAFIVTANNYTTLRMCNIAVNKVYMNKGIEVPQMVSIFLKVYSEWWVLMIVYGIALSLLGLCLQRGWVTDEWFYSAVVVIVVNTFKIYMHNVSKDAPRIRAGLERLNNNLNRHIKRSAMRPSSSL